MPLIRASTGRALLGGAFSPQKLFASGEVGTWLDGTALGLMMQSNGGAAVAVGNPVGRWCSRLNGQSIGALTGPELTVNGSFSSSLAGWTAGSTWAWASPGKAKKTAGDMSTLAQTLAAPVNVGKIYQIRMTLADDSGGLLNVSFGPNFTLTGIISSGINSSKLYYTQVQGNDDAQLIFAPYDTTYNGSVTAVSLMEVKGWHGLQDSSGNRPTAQSKYVDFSTAGTALTVNFGTSISTPCTIAYVDATGYHLLENQTLPTVSGASGNVSSYTLPTGGQIYQVVVINRTLSALEKLLLQADLLSRAS